jgi:hypothetical protein
VLGRAHPFIRHAIMTDDSPRLATLDGDGWALVDAEQRLAARDRLYWIPARWERDHLEEHVPADGYVKLIFRIADPAEPGRPATERMWVTLDARDGVWYHGHLANEPQTTGTAREGMAVWFRAEHVIDYAGPDGEGRASAAHDVLQCARHGPSPTCYVCEHIDMASAGRGFNAALNAGDERPDAWCDECDRLLERVGDWEALGDRHPKVQIVCAGCYDSLRARHERPSFDVGAT